MDERQEVLPLVEVYPILVKNKVCGSERRTSVVFVGGISRLSEEDVGCIALSNCYL